MEEQIESDKKDEVVIAQADQHNYDRPLNDKSQEVMFELKEEISQIFQDYLDSSNANATNNILAKKLQKNLEAKAKDGINLLLKFLETSIHKKWTILSSWGTENSDDRIAFDEIAALIKKYRNDTIPSALEQLGNTYRELHADFIIMARELSKLRQKYAKAEGKLESKDEVKEWVVATIQNSNHFKRLTNGSSTMFKPIKLQDLSELERMMIDKNILSFERFRLFKQLAQEHLKVQNTDLKLAETYENCLFLTLLSTDPLAAALKDFDLPEHIVIPNIDDTIEDPEKTLRYARGVILDVYKNELLAKTVGNLYEKQFPKTRVIVETTENSNNKVESNGLN